MSEFTNRLVYTRDSRALPQPVSGDGEYGPMRGSRYGEPIVRQMGRSRWTAAAQGTYYRAHNATNDAATTIAGHAAPVLVDADATMTKPFLHVVNNDAITSSKLAYLDFIEIEVITAGANGTADSWAAQLDTGSTRITSAGTALTTVNPNMSNSNAPVLAPTAGAIVVSAESSTARQLDHGQFRPSIQVAGDKYMFVFGAEPEACGAAGVTATINRHVVNMGPVVLGPQNFFMLALYSPSQSAAGVYKVRMGWVED